MPSGLPGVRTPRLWMGAAALALAACALEKPPPGHRPDEEAPVITTVTPVPDTIMQGFGGRAVIRFDEPVNLSNNLARELLISPLAEIEVGIGFSGFSFRPVDGWLNGAVYCYTVPEGIRDLTRQRNRTEDPSTFCFSTGPEISDTRVLATVTSGLTGSQTPNVTVLLNAEGDSIPYGGLSGSDGIVEIRSLPPGTYSGYAFLDRNRDFSLDTGIEDHDSLAVEVLVTDTTFLEFSVLPPDTTAPVLGRVLVEGPKTFRLEFDDFLLNPIPDSTVVEVFGPDGEPREVTGLLVGGSASAVVFPEDTITAPEEGDPATPDSVEAPDPGAVPDSVVSQDTAAEADSVVVPDSLGAEPSAADSAAADTTEAETAGEDAPVLLPAQAIIVRTAAVLDSGEYRVVASNVVNVRLHVGGGDTTFVSPGFTEREDSVAAVPDTAEALPDSVAAAPPDTVTVPPDTTGAPPDTLANTRGTPRRPTRPRLLTVSPER